MGWDYWDYYPKNLTQKIKKGPCYNFRLGGTGYRVKGRLRYSNNERKSNEYQTNN